MGTPPWVLSPSRKPLLFPEFHCLPSALFLFQKPSSSSSAPSLPMFFSWAPPPPAPPFHLIFSLGSPLPPGCSLPPLKAPFVLPVPPPVPQAPPSTMPLFHCSKPCLTSSFRYLHRALRYYVPLPARREEVSAGGRRKRGWGGSSGTQTCECDSHTTSHFLPLGPAATSAPPPPVLLPARAAH